MYDSNFLKLDDNERDYLERYGPGGGARYMTSCRGVTSNWSAFASRTRETDVVTRSDARRRQAAAPRTSRDQCASRFRKMILD